MFIYVGLWYWMIIVLGLVHRRLVGVGIGIGVGVDLSFIVRYTVETRQLST